MSDYESYKLHFERMGNSLPSDVITSECIADYYKPWMKAVSKDAKILDCGCGFGHQLYALELMGFRNLFGIEMTLDSYELAKRELKYSDIKHIDAFEYLPKHIDEFDVIILNDVLEHIPRDNVLKIMNHLNDSLKPGGILCIRVPNMSSLLSSYSMYMDFTHLVGYTEFSVMQLLEMTGFWNHKLISSSLKLQWKPKNPILMLRRIVRICLYAANIGMHKFFYLLRKQHPIPKVFDYNLEIYSYKVKHYELK